MLVELHHHRRRRRDRQVPFMRVEMELQMELARQLSLRRHHRRGLHRLLRLCTMVILNEEK